MKIFKRRGLLGVDKQELDALLAAKKFVGLNRSPRAEKIIVSLTSYKPRINDVKYTIYSLLNQTFPPDKLILWLDEDSFPQREKNLPRDLLKLRSFGLTISWCENLRSYKKLIPALEKFPDDIIVTADDDVFYRADWLKILYDEHVKLPDCIIANRVRRIRFDVQGNLFPYKRWRLTPRSKTPSCKNFFTGAGGVLYPKKFFHGDIFNRDLFMKLAPCADDIWFWAMAVLNGKKIKISADTTMSELIYLDIDTELNGETLSSKNIGEGQNDVQLRQIAQHYPALLNALVREDVDSKPYISVVMPTKNSAAIVSCLENIFWQKYPDFELIIINLDAQVALPTVPSNFRVINYFGSTVADALNLGLRTAAGDYVLFKDESTFMLNDALDLIAQAADASAADVIHFAGHVRIVGETGNMVVDDKISLKDSGPIILNMPSQRRAALWLQKKLSTRLDTKIFRRKFLTERGLKFGKDLTEFLFQSLVAAEKYLLVPQAFCFSKETP